MYKGNNTVQKDPTSGPQGRLPRRWKVLKVPYGPEASTAPDILLFDTEDRCREQYERLRQEVGDFGLVLCNGHNEPVFAC
jgi:hypothetical protein